jgi:sugar lactone lactonase YvrE
MIDIETARVFCDGLDGTEPRLDHPEGVAVHPDGSVWCGGERGQIFRIAPDGSSREVVASTEGFCLGLTFAGEHTLYVCDNLHAAVFRLDVRTGALERFADGADGRRMRIPNAIAVAADGTLYISDSHAFKDPGPGIWRFVPDGTGTLWDERPVNFANGVALDPTGEHLYVAASFGHEILRVRIGAGGEAGEREIVASLGAAIPDGVAFDARGRLYIGCYEPSQVLRVEQDGTVAVLLADPEAHMLCHPTNLAFRGTTMFTANLGRWHITAVDVPDLA